MRLKENYTRFIGTAFVLTLAVLVLFQVYIFREPARIANVEAQDKSIAVNAGQALFKTNCTLCHGDNGEGDIGPALNDKTFLKNTADDTIFSIISSGIPGTQMPAWNQSHGGPLTDQNVTQLAAFVRAWQDTAPDRSAQPIKGDASRGQQIFANVCYVCHGDNGTGSDRAPAISDAQHVSQFDNAWYQNTIEQGRPSKGMPTWGTVLSPQQIADLLALVDTWRQSPPTPAVTLTPTASITETATPTATVEVARPSNSGGPGPALTLTGDSKSGEQIFTTDCQKCHGPQGTGNVANPGSTDGTVPPLNPIDPTLTDANPKTFAYNVDLFIEHGSTPEGTNPQLKMPAWGDQKKLAPQQIADVIAYVMSLNPVAASAAVTPTATPTEPAAPEIARPSNPGGPGAGIGMTGNATDGEQVFTANCQKCHGSQGVGNVANPGSTDGTVPALNPIDSTIADTDPRVFAYNIDLFVEHGSTPEGTNPQLVMPAWGDQRKLTSQQIADVIAYVMSLNPTTPITPTEQPAQPSNPGGPGIALALTGDSASGEPIFTTNCQKCHGPQGTGNVANPGSTDGTVPPLNPIDPTLANTDPQIFAYNIDLFLEHGSAPEGSNPQLVMPAWGDQKKLTSQQIADVIAYVMSLNSAAPITPTVPVTPTETPTVTPTATITPTEAAPQIARPSNPGGPGVAINMTGDAKLGEQVFTASCQKCHGPQGAGNVANPGSTDGTVPALNPIDSTIADTDPRVFAYNVDLFVEHGSTPEGANPQLVMPAWGDQRKLTSQQIADVIAYVMSLNPTTPITPTEQPAQPSNAGGPGAALALTGDPNSGTLIFTANCQKCHGPQGVGNVSNPGSTDGTVPPLNPIDPTLANTDPQIFAYNIDLFLEHGSKPEGGNPQLVMPAWGDQKKLTAQQIADVIAYVMNLNKP